LGNRKPDPVSIKYLNQFFFLQCHQRCIDFCPVETGTQDYFTRDALILCWLRRFLHHRRECLQDLVPVFHTAKITFAAPALQIQSVNLSTFDITPHALEPNDWNLPFKNESCLISADPVFIPSVLTHQIADGTNRPGACGWKYRELLPGLTGSSTSAPVPVTSAPKQHHFHC